MSYCPYCGKLIKYSVETECPYCLEPLRLATSNESKRHYCTICGSALSKGKCTKCDSAGKSVLIKNQETGKKDTKYCPRCGEQVDKKETICPKCFASIENPSTVKNYCVNCGTRVNENDASCPKCGQSIGSACSNRKETSTYSSEEVVRKVIPVASSTTGETRKTKYCSKCGKIIDSEAVICVHCGCMVDGAPTSTKTKKSHPIRVVLLCVLLIVAAVGGYFYYVKVNIPNKCINMVKSGHPFEFPEQTYEGALNRFFDSSPEWRYYKESDGSHIVEVTGTKDYSYWSLGSQYSGTNHYQVLFRIDLKTKIITAISQKVEGLDTEFLTWAFYGDNIFDPN